MNKLEILNSIQIEEYDADGSTLYYALVKNTDENRQKLLKIGVPAEEIVDMTGKDGEDIDISGFGFRYSNAVWYSLELGGWLDFIPRERG